MKREFQAKQDWEHQQDYQDDGQDYNNTEPQEEVKEFEEDRIEVLFKDESYEHKPIRYFEEAGFPPQILQVLQSLQFDTPTKIQSHGIPVAMNEFDVIGIAKTGSGKTLAFLLPGLTKLLEQMRYCKENGIKYSNREAPYILVLAPTRELAMQIYNAVLPFTTKLNLSASVVYGGANMGLQIKSIRYVDILVATPGRLIDLLGRNVMRLDQVGYFVLDEADRMLDMGFMPQVEEIMNYLTNQRQSLLWSATWPKEVQALSSQICLNEIATIKVGSDDLTVNSDIEQTVEVVEDNNKLNRLFEILKENKTSEVSKNLIFVKTKVWCERLSEILMSKGINAMALHGDKSQNQRDYIVRQYRKSYQSILVATDVASRGLDIKNIGVVVNFDFPSTIQDYVHRIGRTGRAGQKGKSFTFFSSSDISFARDFINLLTKAHQVVPQELIQLSKRGYGKRSGGYGGGGSYGRYGRGGGGGYQSGGSGGGFGTLHNFRQNAAKPRGMDDGGKSTWNGTGGGSSAGGMGLSSRFGGDRDRDGDRNADRGGREREEGFEGGRVSFFNSTKRAGGDIKPEGKINEPTPAPQSVRNNDRQAEPQSNRGYDNGHHGSNRAHNDGGFENRQSSNYFNNEQSGSSGGQRPNTRQFGFGK